MSRGQEKEGYERNMYKNLGMEKHVRGGAMHREHEGN